MNLISVFFLSCLSIVESFVTTKAQTQLQLENEVLRSVRDITHELASTNFSEQHSGSGKAEELIKSASEHWNKLIDADVRRDVLKERGEFKYESWKEDVKSWTKDARRQMVTRFQTDQKAKKVNSTAVEKVKKTNFFRRFRGRTLTTSEKEGVLVAGSLMDLMMVLFVAIDPQAAWVANVNIALWWVLGIIVHMSEGEMSFIDAAFMMMQIDTTIGFGTNCLTTNGGKLWSALHIFMGTIFVQPQMGGYLEALFDLFDKEMFPLNAETPAGIYFIDLLFYGFAVTGATTLHALVDGTGNTQDWIDGLYMSTASMQTTGYGDLAPNSPLTRGLSVIWATIGSRFYAAHVADAAGRYFNAEHERRFGTPADKVEFIPQDEEGNNKE